MPRAKLSIRLPEGAWIARLSQAHPDARFRVLAALPVEGGGTGLVELTAADPEAVAAEMEGFDGIESVDWLETTGETGLVQFHTAEPFLLLSAREAGLPLRPPVDISDGVASVWATGSPDRLSAFADQLESFGMSFEVERVTPAVDTADLLTERQREVVLEAVERGYYDTPRRCSLTDLADALGVAQSTCSETLHRAEGTIVRAFIEELPGLDRSARPSSE